METWTVVPRCCELRTSSETRISKSRLTPRGKFVVESLTDQRCFDSDNPQTVRTLSIWIQTNEVEFLSAWLDMFHHTIVCTREKSFAIGWCKFLCRSAFARHWVSGWTKVRWNEWESENSVVRQTTSTIHLCVFSRISQVFPFQESFWLQSARTHNLLLLDGIKVTARATHRFTQIQSSRWIRHAFHPCTNTTRSVDSTKAASIDLHRDATHAASSVNPPSPPPHHISPRAPAHKHCCP